MNALNNALIRLLYELDNKECLINKDKASDIIYKWAKNEFDECASRTVFNVHPGTDNPAYKVHAIKAQLIQQSLEVAAKHGIGTEEISHKWEALPYPTTEYRPEIAHGKFQHELLIKFYCLRRTPVSFYKQETPEELLKRLLK